MCRWLTYSGRPIYLDALIFEPENFELPGADLSGEELSVRVIPKQADEFTCSSCFLVHHRSQLDHEGKGGPICRDCA